MAFSGTTRVRNTAGLCKFDQQTTTTTTILRPFFRDHPGEPAPEENIRTLWCKGKLTEADTPTIRLGTTPSRLSSAHLHHPPHTFYRLDALPAAQPTVSKHWRQLAHSDYGEDARVLLNGVTCTVSVAYPNTEKSNKKEGRGQNVVPVSWVQVRRVKLVRCELKSIVNEFIQRPVERRVGHQLPMRLTGTMLNRQQPHNKLLTQYTPTCSLAYDIEIWKCGCANGQQLLTEKLYLTLWIIFILRLIMTFRLTTTTPQPFYGLFSGTTRVSRWQKRTSGLYGARED